MITILDEIATESDIGKIYMDACGLSLEATTTDISGKSEALEKFLSSYAVSYTHLTLPTKA